MKKVTSIIYGPRQRLEHIRTEHCVPVTIKIYETICKYPNYFKYFNPFLSPFVSPEDIYNTYLDAIPVPEQSYLGKLTYFMFNENNIIGQIAAFQSPDRPSTNVNLGYFLFPDALGHGYMQEAVKMIEPELFTNQRVDKINLEICTENHASLKVAQKTGYTQHPQTEKTYIDFQTGDLMDSYIYYKLKSDWQKIRG